MPASNAPDKIDLYKLHKQEYVTPKTPQVVTVGKAQYLTMEGKGAPGSPAFAQAIEALYGLAYTLKFASKTAGQDYKVSGLEGLWWFPEGHTTPTSAPPGTWRWNLIIRVPDFVSQDQLAQAKASLAAKNKGGDLLPQVRLETIEEGPCVQMLHVGPYDQEAENVERMRQFASAQRLAFHGAHHEIYLSDPRRVPPERLRTILRMPVRTA
ncbi:MAG: GyrI-like domain-containing protein [Dehalococcoidia bacterium]|nr:GyrI-like domain-containing protein [Dehalococcoidia bacterium]